MTTPRKVLRIDELRNKVIGFMDIGGIEREVRAMTFEVQQLLTADVAPDGDESGHLKAAVRKVVPSITDEELGSLTPDAAQAILTFSGGGIEAVEKAFPNAVRPET